MSFSSLEFLCVFFPVVFLTYCMLPGIRLKNALLLIASLLFYAYGEPVYVLLMICSACFNYVIARMTAALPYKKACLTIGIAVNLGVLIIFKYTAFFVDTWNRISGMGLSVPDIRLPIGISFFTFQALSYVIDVYRAKILAQKNFWNVLLYISFFPQLTAGPIVKYRSIRASLNHREAGLAQITQGLRRFICGLGKKVLIADTVGLAADAVFCAEAANINLLSAWVGAVSYMLQIYYDFSGYSDMAIGMGRMFGFVFEENFAYPYGAASVKEFWRRWHISLSSWFREYLYIPLGGNRKGTLRTCCHKLAVFFCTGFWHGADWTFIVWGLYHGFFSMIEDLVPFTKKLPKPIAYLYTMLVVCTGFVFFRADSLSQGMFLIQQMFTGSDFGSRCMSFVTSLLTPWFLAMLFLAVIGMAPVKPCAAKIRGIVYGQEECAGWKYHAVQLFLSVGSIVVLLWCMVRLSGSTYHPFIYFRF